MSFLEVMDILKSIVGQRADADNCYYYIDDERTIRLEKLLGLPNSFETRIPQMTDKERAEKHKREAIEVYYLKSATPALPKSPKKDQEAPHESSS